MLYALCRHSEEKAIEFLSDILPERALKEEMLLAFKDSIHAYVTKKEAKHESRLYQMILDSVLQRDFYEQDANSFSPFRVKHPTAIVWIPTWKCDQNCLYCGVPKIDEYEQESRISYELMMDRLHESIALGTQQVVFHGGEPLWFYERIFDAVKDLADHNVFTSTSTKGYIDIDIARRLAGAGLHVLQISIDTVNPDISHALYANESLFEYSFESIKNATRCNIVTDVNVLATKANYQDLPFILERLNALSIRNVFLSEFRKGPSNTLDLSLDDKHYDWLREHMDYECYNFALTALEPTLLKGYEQKPVCASMRSSMVVLPDGTCSYCDFLIDKEFCIGDLHQQSVAEVWNGKEFSALLHPDKELFHGSACYSCEGFESCAVKGFCYTAMDTPYSPDYRALECLGGKHYVCSAK